MQSVFRDFGKLIAALWVAQFALSAQTFFNFTGADGANPKAAPIQTTSGYLYGTTSAGGADVVGDIYRITPAGTFTLVHSFDESDGCYPGAGLIEGFFEATRGYLYGTTLNCEGAGTVFRIGPNGLTTVYGFSGGSDGGYPTSGLVQTADGWIYGTTSMGGPSNCGTVFKIANNGDFTSLFSFNCTNGNNPQTLVEGFDGNLYGTTQYGGSADAGTVFKMTPDGVLTTLHTFCVQPGCPDGSEPTGALTQAANGNFYGTASSTIFEMTPQGALTVLHTFNGTDGAESNGSLVLASNGNLYGTTSLGGTDGNGTIFEISTGGAFASLYSFTTNDFFPEAGLTQDTNGDFYGTTLSSATGNGSYFKLSEGLRPFVTPLPTAAKPMVWVWIEGTNLTGASAVSFSGVSTTFNVVSDSLIDALVPAGASNGPIEVVTPTATLQSVLPFRVL